MDTTIKKVQSGQSPAGDMGQKYLVAGKRMFMRLWEKKPTQDDKEASSRDYETIGFVIDGKAELTIAGQTVSLEKGDCWLVPAGAKHSYKMLEPFVAVEATSPPSELHGRDTNNLEK